VLAPLLAPRTLLIRRVRIEEMTSGRKTRPPRDYDAHRRVCRSRQGGVGWEEQGVRAWHVACSNALPLLPLLVLLRPRAKEGRGQRV